MGVKTACLLEQLPGFQLYAAGHPLALVILDIEGGSVIQVVAVAEAGTRDGIFFFVDDCVYGGAVVQQVIWGEGEVW